MNVSFIRRLGYYLGGFSVGIILLTFILSGKKTSCNYGPNARVIDKLTKKKIILSPTIRKNFSHLNDSIIKVYVTHGNVNFSKSDTQRDSCRLYHIDTKNKLIALQIENCKKAVLVVGYQVVSK
tara:strand:+ start:3523 stop:3894 length:372 start_codon:yes stop_codon:yes gene_type:complete